MTLIALLKPTAAQNPVSHSLPSLLLLQLAFPHPFILLLPATSGLFWGGPTAGLLSPADPGEEVSVQT